MATSGSVNGNTVTYGCYSFLNWQLAGQETGNNRSLINWQAYFHFQGSDAQLDNGAVWSNYGTHWVNGGRVYNYTGNFTTRNLGLASGSFWANHNSVGNADLQFGVGVTSGFGRSEGVSGVWSLPQIPRQAYLTNLSQDIDDLADPWVEFSNAGGFAVNAWLEVAGTRYFQTNNVGSRFTWSLTTGNRNTLRALTPNSKTMTIRYVIETYISGTYYTDWRDRVYTVVDADPAFTTVTYRDSNSTTSTITGDDQYLIQGYGTLEMKIASGDKAIAQKSATMVKYNSAISSISVDTTYTTSAIAQALGVLGVAVNTDLLVKAIDSRGYFTTVTKNIKVLPYVVPNVVATAQRVNNFEMSTNIHIAGTISRLTISGTDKNAVNTSTGVAYRYKKVSDVSWGSWTNKTSATSAGAVSVTDFAVNLDRNYAWNLEVRITDKLNTSTLALIVPIGTPIFRISTYDNKIYNNEVEVMPTINDATLADATVLANTASVPTRKNVKDYVDALFVMKSAPTTSNVNPSNGNNNFASAGASVSLTVPTGKTATVQFRIDVGLSSTTDFEFIPLLYVGSTVTQQYAPHASLGGGAGNRATYRGFTGQITLTAGTYTLSAGAYLASSTSSLAQAGGQRISVIAVGAS